MLTHHPVIEAVCTSETSVNIYFTTQQYIPEDSKLHTRHHKNLKCHMDLNHFVCGNNCKKRDLVPTFKQLTEFLDERA
jgi:hypothetical protein